MKRHDVSKGDRADVRACAFFAMRNQFHARLGRKLTDEEENVIRWHVWRFSPLVPGAPN